MGKYAGEHADALRDIETAGAEIVFSKRNTVVSGHAIQVSDDQEYERTKLVEMETVLLLFVAETYGQVPPLGSLVDWGGLRHQVEAVEKIAPDGVAILSRVRISR